jgi:hypothetical protein
MYVMRTRHPIENDSENEVGAAAVELAVAMIGLLFLVALIIDGCLLFQRYSLLTEKGADITRTISAEIVRTSPPPGGCDELCSRARTLVEGFSEGADLQGLNFSPTIIASGSTELGSYAVYPLIRIDSSATARCLFCSLLPWEVNLTATSLLVIESATTSCNDMGNHPC